MPPRNPSRRRFLGEAAALGLSGLLLPRTPGLFAEARVSRAGRPARPPTLVAIYLRGGNDALNTVVPWANPRYHEVRPRISIQAETTADEPGVLKLTDKVGLHPALSGLMPFWQKKQLAAVLNVGSPHGTRSHFDAQDFMEYAAPGDRTLRDGWLNRYLAATRKQGQSDLRALGMQGLLPRSLRGNEAVLAVPNLRSGDSEGLLDLFDDVYKGGTGEGAMGGETMGGESRGGEAMKSGKRDGAESGREEAVHVGRETIETLRRFWEISEKDPPGDQAVKYPDGVFARRLAILSRVIRNDAGVEVAALDVGGWDHHQGEGSTDGSIQRDLKGLGDALAAFATDLGPALDRVLVLVMTEFGRTVAENGNRGTDHGRGAMMLALGGPVNGGKIYGDYGTLDPKTLADGRDLPVEIDFRQVFHETLAGLFDFAPPKGFFPLFTPKNPLGLVKKA